MTLIPKFLREFPANTTTVVEDDIVPISRADEDDSYKISVKDLRNDVLKQPLVGLKEPYVYGNPQYVPSEGTIMHNVTGGPNGVLFSSSTDFATLMPGYLISTSDPETPDVEVIFVEKHLDGALIGKINTDAPWTGPTNFQYKACQFAVLADSDWPPLSGDSILLGTINEYTQNRYEPVKSPYIFTSGLDAQLNLDPSTWVQLIPSKVSWNSWNEWDLPNGYFQPLYNGLYRIGVHFTIKLSAGNFQPGDAYNIVLAHYPISSPPPGTAYLRYAASYPSINQGLHTIDFSSYVHVYAGVRYAIYIYNTSIGAFIQAVPPNNYPVHITIEHCKSELGV